VHQQARELVERTRDLRAAVLFTRSGARVEGLAGAVRGLQLVRGLLERYWDDVHPRLDAGAGGDPTARLNALSALSHPAAGLADFRCASLTGQRGSVTVRDIELAMGRAEPLPGEGVPTEEGVMQGLQAAIAAQPGVAQQMLDASEACLALTACFEQRLDATSTPDLEALQRLLKRVAITARRATDAAAEAAEAAGPGTSDPRSAPTAPPGSLSSREDVIRSLERACEWIERNEPTNPAPLLIRRSQRLMTKNFVDIIRDLVPEGVAQIEKLAGSGK
jgi:type VI secretion system protein ImpA